LRDGGDGGVAQASARRIVEDKAAQVDEILEREGVNRRQVEVVVRVAVFVKEVGLVQNERTAARRGRRFGGGKRRNGSERAERGGSKRSGERSFNELAAVEHRRGLLMLTGKRAKRVGKRFPDGGANVDCNAKRAPTQPKNAVDAKKREISTPK
jgi:hypothetical protein